MKRFIFLPALIVFTATVIAQDSLTTTDQSYGYTAKTSPRTFIFSLGVEPTLTVGNFHHFASSGLGGSVQGEYKPGSNVGVTLNAGYIDYFGRTVNGTKYSDFKYWPIMGGVKIYMSKTSFIHPQAGPGFGTNGLGTSFWYGAGIGFNLSRAIDAEFKYTGWKQGEIAAHGSTGAYGGTGGTAGTGGYGTTAGTGGTGATGGTSGGGYGGHYSTLGVRLGINF